MSKFTKPVKDSISQKLGDDRVRTIDLDTENAIVEAFLDGRPWPNLWKRMTFDPANEMTDTLKLLAYFWPDSRWQVICDEPGKVYTAWLDEETYTVSSFCPERALLLAMWTVWRIGHDERGDL